MRKKIIAFMMSICLVVGLSGCNLVEDKKSEKKKEKVLKVVVATEAFDEAEKEYRAAKNMVKEYIKNDEEDEDSSDNKKEGKKEEAQELEDSVIHIVLPKNTDEANKKIVKLSKDEDIRGIVLATDRPGMLPALKQIREKRPDIVTVCASTPEEPAKISEWVDLCIDTNMLEVGENIVTLSKELGAKTFIYYSSKSDLADEKINNRRNKIKETCKNENVKFIEVLTPEYLTEKGKSDMQKFLEEDIQKKVDQYGKDINILGANDSMDEIIIKNAIKLKYIVAQQSNPSPVDGYPAAMGIKLSKKDSQNFSKVNDMISEKAKEKGISNRLGGVPMPTSLLLTELSVHIAVQMVEEDLTQEDVSDPDYLEKFAEEKYGIGAIFEKANEEIDNYQLMTIEQIIY